jgi:iron complex outermembrane receptor protein
MSRNKYVAAAGLVVGGLAAVPVHAELVDYGALQSVFGEPVTTSATGKPQQASQAPVAMTIISADDISHAAAVTIPGILREYTDLDVWEFARGDSDVGVRGYDQAMSSRLLVLINGRQVYLDYYGFTAWDSLPVQLSEIRQIEVVKGPNSALFGFNAAAGVINIVTYNPLYDKVNDLTARVGTQSYKEVSGAVTGQIPNLLGVRLSTGGYDAHQFDTPSQTLLLSPEISNGAEKRSVNLDSAFQLSDAIQGRLEAAHNINNQLQYVNTYLGAHQRTQTDSAKVTMSADTGIGAIDATAYTDVDHIMPDIKNFDFNNVTAVAQLQDLFKPDADHTFRVAGEYRYNELNSVPNKGANISYTDLAVSGMWDWAALPALDVTNALRYDSLSLGRNGTEPAVGPFTNADFNRQSINKLSANSGAVYKLTAIDSLRATFGRGLQVPNLFAYAMNGGAPLPEMGDPHLLPIITTNYELGYSRDLVSLSSKLTSSVFYQTNEQLIKENWTFTAPLQARNVGNSEGYGAEIGLTGHSASFRWGGSYRFEQIAESLSVPPYSLYPVDFGGSAPHHLLTVRGGYTLGKWEFDLFGRYSSSYAMPETHAGNSFQRFVVPNYVTADARVAYHVTPSILLTVSGIGVQSKNTVYTSGQAVERQVYGTLNVKF